MYRILVISLYVLSITSCTLPSVCHLYNDTGKELSVEITDSTGKLREVGLKPANMKRIKGWSLISKLKISVFDVTHKEITIWKYESLQYVGVEYWKWKGWWIFARHYFDAQIQSNGTIAILGKNQKHPIQVEDAAIKIQPTSQKN